MLSWMLYGLGVGALLSLAAVLTETGLRWLGHPAGRVRARWIWAGVMAATAAAPVVAFVAALGAPPAAWGAAPPASDALDAVVLTTWMAVTFALLANVRLSLWTVERNVRSWRRELRGGKAVLVSSGFGPGVVGAVTPRIVLPAWARGGDPGLEGFILAHEEEHVRAGDTRLLLAGVLLVAVLPWCLPLWWQLHRLRGAIEVDCDARVLAQTDAPRRYAEALVTVAGRRTRSPLPVPGLSPTGHELERRIRLITAAPAAHGWRGGALLAAALLLGASPALLPHPEVPRPWFDVNRTVDAPVPTPPPNEAFVILSVEPEITPTAADR